MRKQSSTLPLPRGSRGDSFSMPHSASSTFSKFGSKYIGGGVGKQEGQGLWQDILRSFMNGLQGKNAENLHGTLFVLGRANGGKSELISELKKISEKGREKDTKNVLVQSDVDKSPYIGLDFCSMKISRKFFQSEQDDSIEDSDQDELDKDPSTIEKNATLDVWSVDHCGMSDELVKRLVDVFNSQNSCLLGNSTTENSSLNVSSVDIGLATTGVIGGSSLEEDSRDNAISIQSPNIMFLIVLDSSLPWTLNDDLVTWIQQIQECWSKSLELTNLSPDLQRIMIQEVNHYFEIRVEEAGIEAEQDSGSGPGAKAVQDTAYSQGEETVQHTPKLGDTEAASFVATSNQYPRVNLGIPIGVVLSKSDIGQRFSVPTDGATGQPFIPFALSFLMNVGDSYGISFFITSIQTSGDIHQAFGVDLLLSYILHRLFDTPFTDEDGKVLKTVNDVVNRNNTILCVLPRTPLHRLCLTPTPNVKSEIYEELVQKSKFSSGVFNSGDTSELVHGLSTAFDKKIPSLNEFLEQIRPQIPLIEAVSPGAAPVLLSPTATSNSEESKSISGDSASIKGTAGGASSSAGSLSGSSQRLKPSKSSLNSNNPSSAGDPSLKGFFQSLIQRGEKKGSLSHRSNLKPTASMNLRKEFGSRMESKLSSEVKLDDKIPDSEIVGTNSLETEKAGSIPNDEENIEKPIEESAAANSEVNSNDKQTE
ncbi:cytoplasmic dynein 1 light intermediate chain 1-like [Cryptosporidium sp. chipmunk genotype I]|uniref:cytoplasmic dynein 1 light intermediate chain 1-like n=1 Tax=Cryptosporidium sp. chipmunk genotype I TaxID=1280935 RepID=UPI00351A1EEB|nr:cytoplasmic dynein 1 light intermediate chain 1-like [Cryptosporidium sp. chipmunk genotype I]